MARPDMGDAPAMDDAPDPELTAQLAAAPFVAFLGIELVSAPRHEVIARLAWSEDERTAGGVLPGRLVARVTQTQAVL